MTGRRYNVKRVYGVDNLDRELMCGHQHSTIKAAVDCARRLRCSYVVRAASVDSGGAGIVWEPLTRHELRLWARAVEAPRARSVR